MPLSFENIIVSTPCRVSFGRDIEGSTNEKDYRYFYIREFFHRDNNFLTGFLKRLRFKNVINEKDESVTFTAEGGNDIAYVYAYDQDMYLKQAENTKFCYITKELVNKMIENTDVEDYYREYWLDLLFNPDNEELQRAKNQGLLVNNNDMIMFPDLNLYYISKKLGDKITNYKKKRTQTFEDVESIHDNLKDIIFTVIVKPDNYKDLQDRYSDYLQTEDINILNRVRNELIAQDYKNLVFLTNGNVSKLKRIQKSIHEFYAKFDILPETVKISVQDTFNKNMWLNIKTQFRDIYKGEYLYYRLTYMHRMEDLDALIRLLEEEVVNLDKRYQRTFQYSIVEKYEFTDEMCPETKQVKERNLKLYYKGRYDTELVNKYPDILGQKGNNFKLKDFKVNRIFYNKISKNSTICSISVCISFTDNPDKFYLVNIIPRTVAFIQNLWNNGRKELLKKYISGYKHNKDFVENSSTKIDYGYKYDLKYWIEIVDLKCFNCEGVGRCDTSSYLKEVIDSGIKRQKLIILKEDGELAQNFLDSAKKNGRLSFYVIIYNIITSLFHMYNGGEDINKLSKIINKLAKIEENYNISIYRDIIETNKLVNYPGRKYKDYLNNRSTYFINLLLNHNIYDFFNNKTYIKYFGGDFIFVPSSAYIPHIGTKIDIKNEKFKYLMWYVHFTFNMDQLNNDIIPYLESVAIERINYYKNNLQQFINAGMYIGVGSIYININNFTKEFYNYDTNIKYLYNIFSLFNKETKKLDKKAVNDINNIINSFKENIDNSYIYIFYHYPVTLLFTTLHLHIYSRYTKQAFQMRAIFSYGSGYTYETSKYYMFDFTKLTNNFYDNHLVPVDLSTKKYNKNNIYTIIKDDLLNFDLPENYIDALLEYNNYNIQNFVNNSIATA